MEFGVKYKFKVVDVIDGDTIDVMFPNGSVERVRMLCVDTLETTASKLEGKYVWIELDSLAGMRGYYGRLLAYVYYPTETDDFTAELIKLGYARVYKEGECKKESEYLQYQSQAMENGVGLWSACKETTLTSTPVTTTATPTTQTVTSKNCDPSYPDVCIPPPPPDLDCKDIPYRNFRVLPPDPHHFDGDHDGIGCEE